MSDSFDMSPSEFAEAMKNISLWFAVIDPHLHYSEVAESADPIRDTVSTLECGLTQLKLSNDTDHSTADKNGRFTSFKPDNVDEDSLI